ncbi:MAG: hypothetical protein AB1941_29090 [Gemmatimonadota bacterium]
MLKNRLSIFAVAGLAALAACGGDEAEVAEGEGVVTDTLIDRGTETVPVVAEVPVADTSVVVTQSDTTIDMDRDTVPVSTTQP